MMAWLSVVTWNAAALFHQDWIKRRARRSTLEQLLNNFCIIGLQETHGGLEDFEVMLPRVRGCLLPWPFCCGGRC